jgi:hypothetical protein
LKCGLALPDNHARSFTPDTTTSLGSWTEEMFIKTICVVTPGSTSEVSFDLELRQ